MKKEKLLQTVVERLKEDLDLYRKAALASRADATDEQSEAEHKYDTLGLESSFLAQGQSRQALELQEAIAQFEQLPAREFSPDEPIKPGAVVELQSGPEKDVYFLGPRAGGTEVMFEQKEVLVITPESPLGSQLVGKKQGEKYRFELAGRKKDYTVAAVW